MKKNTGTMPMVFANPTRVLHISLPREDQAARVLCFVVTILVVSYVSLVSVSVINVIASQEAADQMAALRTSVSALEHDYFALSEGITADSGAIIGLVPVSNISYVTQSNTVGAIKMQRSDI